MKEFRIKFKEAETKIRKLEQINHSNEEKLNKKDNQPSYWQSFINNEMVIERKIESDSNF